MKQDLEDHEVGVAARRPRSGTPSLRSSYLGQHLLERLLVFFHRRGYDLALGNRQVQNRPFLHFGIFSQRLGNSNRQAIPPLLNANMHADLRIYNEDTGPVKRRQGRTNTSEAASEV